MKIAKHLGSIPEVNHTRSLEIVCMISFLILKMNKMKKSCKNDEQYLKSDKVSENGLSEICGRQPLKNLKRYGLPKQTISLQIF